VLQVSLDPVGDEVVRVSKDIRSQRICRAEDDQLMWVVKIDTTTGGGIFMTALVRTLVRLP